MKIEYSRMKLFSKPRKYAPKYFRVDHYIIWIWEDEDHFWEQELRKDLKLYEVLGKETSIELGRSCYGTNEKGKILDFPLIPEARVVIRGRSIWNKDRTLTIWLDPVHDSVDFSQLEKFGWERKKIKKEPEA